ncbi:MAG: hypothetical protein WDW38_006785 [Sanguina aurantia]
MLGTHAKLISPARGLLSPSLLPHHSPSERGAHVRVASSTPNISALELLRQENALLKSSLGSMKAARVKKTPLPSDSAAVAAVDSTSTAKPSAAKKPRKAASKAASRAAEATNSDSTSTETPTEASAPDSYVDAVEGGSSRA